MRGDGQLITITRSHGALSRRLFRRTVANVLEVHTGAYSGTRLMTLTMCVRVRQVCHGLDRGLFSFIGSVRTTRRVDSLGRQGLQLLSFIVLPTYLNGIYLYRLGDVAGRYVMLLHVVLYRCSCLGFV